MNSNKVCPMLRLMIAKFRNKLLPALLLLLPTPIFTPPQASAQIVAKANKNLYSETSDATSDIAAALAQARREHKRVILDFGGNWCGDCQVLDIYYHRAPNDAILNSNYVLVDIQIGHVD